MFRTMHLTRDEELTVLADCQRILRDPERCKYLVDQVAYLRRVAIPATLPEDCPDSAQVRRAVRLGVSIEWDDQAPKGGELVRRLYSFRFLYRRPRHITTTWKRAFGNALKRAIDKHVTTAVEDAATV